MKAKTENAIPLGTRNGAFTSFLFIPSTMQVYLSLFTQNKPPLIGGIICIVPHILRGVLMP